MKELKISDRYIGGSHPCFIIAEIGSNHNGSFDTARKLVDAAKGAGADAVKFQSFTVENWISRDLTHFPTVKEKGSLARLLKDCELPYPLYSKIKRYCAKRGIICFSSPSHITDIKKLLAIGTPAFKFGSVQITDLPTIAFAARSGKPILISTGASTMGEIRTAVAAVRACGNKNAVLLHCTTLYPAPLDTLHLNMIMTLKRKFDVPVGFSDHSMDPVIAPVAAAALGASLIEKHMTLDRGMKGPDHRFALQPDEFREMVRAVRSAEASLGRAVKPVLPGESEIARLGRRSVVAASEIAKGAAIRRAMLTLKRPGTGIEPRYLENIIGKKARRRIEKDTVITWEKIA